jgi:hypothetical protein
MKRRLAAAAFAATILTGFAAPAFADPPVGNSGHSSNGSTQCKAGGVDKCPPFGPK